MHLEVELTHFYLSYRPVPSEDYEEAKRIIERQIKAEMGLDARVFVCEEAKDVDKGRG